MQKKHNVLFLNAKGRTARQGKGKKDGGRHARKREKRKKILKSGIDFWTETG